MLPWVWNVIGVILIIASAAASVIIEEFADKLAAVLPAAVIDYHILPILILFSLLTGVVLIILTATGVLGTKPQTPTPNTSIPTNDDQEKSTSNVDEDKFQALWLKDSQIGPKICTVKFNSHNGELTLVNGDGQVLWRNFVSSKRSLYNVAMDVDNGTIEIFDFGPKGGSMTSVWKSSNSAGTNRPYVFEVIDCNFLIRDKDNTVVWSALPIVSSPVQQNTTPTILPGAKPPAQQTAFVPPFQCASSADGNNTECTSSLVAPLKSDPASTAPCKLDINQSTGVLALINEVGKTIWSTVAGNGTGPYKTFMQSDGNLVVYDSKGQSQWSTQTRSTNGPFRAALGNDCNLALYDKDNQAIWATQTWNQNRST